MRRRKLGFVAGDRLEQVAQVDLGELGLEAPDRFGLGEVGPQVGA
jgi:hypothetical protein